MSWPDRVQVTADVLTIVAVLIGFVAVVRYAPWYRRKIAMRRLSKLGVKATVGYFSAELDGDPAITTALTDVQRSELAGAGLDRWAGDMEPTHRHIWIRPDYFVAAVAAPSAQVVAFAITSRSKGLRWQLPRLSHDLPGTDRLFPRLVAKLPRRWSIWLGPRLWSPKLCRSRLSRMRPPDCVWSLHDPAKSEYVEGHTLYQASGSMWHFVGTSYAGWTPDSLPAPPRPADGTGGPYEYVNMNWPKTLDPAVADYRTQAIFNTYAATLVIPEGTQLAWLQFLGLSAWEVMPVLGPG